MGFYSLTYLQSRFAKRIGEALSSAGLLPTLTPGAEPVRSQKLLLVLILCVGVQGLESSAAAFPSVNRAVDQKV